MEWFICAFRLVFPPFTAAYETLGALCARGRVGFQERVKAAHPSGVYGLGPWMAPYAGRMILLALMSSSIRCAPSRQFAKQQNRGVKLYGEVQHTIDKATEEVYVGADPL